MAPDRAAVSAQAAAAASVREPARGVGEGHGGGTGGGVYKIGGGVSPPTVIFKQDPEYSEEARKAKFQGTCIVQIIVGVDGRPRDIKVVRTLGLGLDEKAVEAISKYKFEPGKD